MSLQLLHERDELGLERGEQLAHEAPRLGGAAPRLAPLPALAPLAVAAVALTSLSYLVTYALCVYVVTDELAETGLHTD